MTGNQRAKRAKILSLERGTIFKEPGGRINICLVYPNTYSIGMSSLGFQGVYTLLNSYGDVVCERAFLPDAEDMPEYERTGSEPFSLESGRPLSAFDVIAFSVAFENDYPNVLNILNMAKIPLGVRLKRRPLLVLGGVCAFSNPEPLAPFFDLVLVGEAEELIPDFLELLRRASGRDEIFEGSTELEGFYVPSFYEVDYGPDGLISGRSTLGGAPETVRRRYVMDLSGASMRPSIITPEAEFSGMYLLEAMRGCPWNCRFCLAGHVFNPPRKVPLAAIEAGVRDAGEHGARVGLIGPSLSDYQHAEDVLSMEGVDFSITSLRASPKSARLAALMKGARSVSIAPEAGTERMRRVIDKRITEDDIMKTAEAIFAEGFDSLRLYFMVGLPTETDEDIDGIIELALRVRRLSAKGHISLTLSVFVPKPFTPFQWHPMEAMATIKARIGRVRKALDRKRGMKVLHDVPKYAYMQGLFSMGDRRVAAVLKQMLQEPDWRKAAKAAGIDPARYIFRKRDVSEALPWDFLESGPPKGELWDRYQKALAAGDGSGGA